MDLFTLARINDMDAAGKGNIDERVVVAVSVFGGILGFFDTIRIVGVGIAVLRCTVALRAVGIICRLPIQQLIQRYAIQRGKRNKVIGIGRGFAALPFAHGLTAYAQLGSQCFLGKPGSFAAVDEALCHRKIHRSSFRLMVESNEPSMPRTVGSDHHF